MSDLNKAEEMMILAAANRLLQGRVPSSPHDILKMSSGEARQRATRDFLTMLSAEENINPAEIARSAYIGDAFTNASGNPAFKATEDKRNFRSLLARKLNQIRNEFPPGAERQMSTDAVFDSMRQGFEENPTLEKRTRRAIKKSRKMFPPMSLMGSDNIPSTMQKLVSERRAKGMLPLILLSLLGIGGLGLAGAASSGDQA